jgi:hypothetical protein
MTIVQPQSPSFPPPSPPPAPICTEPPAELFKEPFTVNISSLEDFILKRPYLVSMIQHLFPDAFM